MAEPRITPESIDAARREFLLLVDEGVAFDHVVIARDVTAAELCTARREWFDRVKVALLTDGSLVVTGVPGSMHDAVAAELSDRVSAYVTAELVRQIGAYARANRVVLRDRATLVVRGGGFTTPSFPPASSARGDAVDEEDDAYLDDRSDEEA